MSTDLLTPFLTRILEKVPGVSTDYLTSAQVAANLLQALKEYSRYVPAILVKDIVGDGSYEYTLPAGWVSDFSVIQSVEYPAGISQDPADALLQPEKYGIYKNATTSKLRFYDTSPAAGNTARVTFTVPHSVTTDVSTVFANDFDAVCAIAAGFCCFDLARRFAQDQDSMISADSVDRRTKSDRYQSLGKSLVGEFSIHFGLDKEAAVIACSSMKNYDIYYPGGIDQITHPAVNR